MKKLLLLSLLFIVGCAPTSIRSAFIQPNDSCRGYNVYLYGIGGINVVMSKCLTIEDATVLAAKINKDMQNNWSGNALQ